VRVTVRFTVRGDGIIDAHCEPANGVFDEALKDAIGSRAPRGARHHGLSTYWIDLTESMLRLALDDGSTEAFASGNVTYLRVEGDKVLAAYEFDAPGECEESMPVVEFLNLLEEWRGAVIEAGGVSGAEARLLTEESPPRAAGPAT
jgi:hypothetical protein